MWNSSLLMAADLLQTKSRKRRKTNPGRVQYMIWESQPKHERMGFTDALDLSV